MLQRVAEQEFAMSLIQRTVASSKPSVTPSASTSADPPTPMASAPDEALARPRKVDLHALVKSSRKRKAVAPVAIHSEAPAPQQRSSSSIGPGSLSSTHSEHLEPAVLGAPDTHAGSSVPVVARKAPKEFNPAAGLIKKPPSNGPIIITHSAKERLKKKLGLPAVTPVQAYKNAAAAHARAEAAKQVSASRKPPKPEAPLPAVEPERTFTSRDAAVAYQRALALMKQNKPKVTATVASPSSRAALPAVSTGGTAGQKSAASAMKTHSSQPGARPVSSVASLSKVELVAGSRSTAAVLDSDDSDVEILTVKRTKVSSAVPARGKQQPGLQHQTAAHAASMVQAPQAEKSVASSVASIPQKVLLPGRVIQRLKITITSTELPKIPLQTRMLVRDKLMQAAFSLPAAVHDALRHCSSAPADGPSTASRCSHLIEAGDAAPPSDFDHGCDSLTDLVVSAENRLFYDSRNPANYSHAAADLLRLLRQTSSVRCLQSTSATTPAQAGTTVLASATSPSVIVAGDQLVSRDASVSLTTVLPAASSQALLPQNVEAPVLLDLTEASLFGDETETSDLASHGHDGVPSASTPIVLAPS